MGIFTLVGPTQEKLPGDQPSCLRSALQGVAALSSERAANPEVQPSSVETCLVAETFVEPPLHVGKGHSPGTPASLSLSA